MPAAADINPSTGKAYAINPSSGVWDDNYFAKNFGGASTPSSGGSVNNNQNMQDVTNAANKASDNYNNLVASNTKAVTDFLPKYQSDVQNAQNTAYDKFGVGTHLGAVNALTSRIADLSGNTSNSGGGSSNNTGLGGFANAGQVDAAINSRYLPQLSAEGSNLNNSLSAANQYVGQQLAPDQAYKDLLTTNISTAMSGLSAEQQTTLNAILGKLQSGTALTQTEIQTGEDAAQQALNRAQQMTIEKLTKQYTPISSGQVTINPSTGQVVNPYMLATQNGGVYTP